MVLSNSMVHSLSMVLSDRMIHLSLMVRIMLDGYGAPDRDRTCMSYRTADFKSTVYTIPPQGHGWAPRTLSGSGINSLYGSSSINHTAV